MNLEAGSQHRNDVLIVFRHNTNTVKKSTTEFPNKNNIHSCLTGKNWQQQTQPP